MVHRDKSQSREFTVGIGWKADICGQVLSAEPVAIDPADLSLAQLIKDESEPPLAEVAKAIEMKNSADLAKAYRKLTNACNNCHQTAGVGFIVIAFQHARLSAISSLPPKSSLDSRLQELR